MAFLAFDFDRCACLGKLLPNEDTLGPGARKALPGMPLRYYTNMPKNAAVIVKLNPEGDEFRTVARTLNLWREFLAWRQFERVQTDQTPADRKSITEMSTRIRSRIRNSQHRLIAITDLQLRAFLHQHLQRFGKLVSGNP